ncbi:MAG: hypothetical protein ACRESO_10095 [Gammaproteobacteria bacterium]
MLTFLSAAIGLSDLAILSIGFSLFGVDNMCLGPTLSQFHPSGLADDECHAFQNARAPRNREQGVSGVF